jgi:hypothetical protein
VRRLHRAAHDLGVSVAPRYDGPPEYTSPTLFRDALAERNRLPAALRRPGYYGEDPLRRAIAPLVRSEPGSLPRIIALVAWYFEDPAAEGWLIDRLGDEEAGWLYDYAEQVAQAHLLEHGEAAVLGVTDATPGTDAGGDPDDH